MHLETDLSKMKHLAEVRDIENIRFRTYLKRKDGRIVDNIVHDYIKQLADKLTVQNVVIAAFN